MSIVCKSAGEIEKMRRSGRILRQVIDAITPLAQPGATTMDLERATLKKLKELGAKAAFKGLYDYPCALCTSVNEEVVHGIPSDRRVLKNGDILSIDFGVLHDGYYSDSALTLPIGEISEECAKLIRVTRESLELGLAEAKIGATLGDIGAAVQEHAESNGFSVVREYVGHGIGSRLHEDPQIPNYGRRGHGTKLREGMVLAIEPMINAGLAAVRELADKWTVVTADGRPSAHYEHTVAVTKDGPVILTD